MKDSETMEGESTDNNITCLSEIVKKMFLLLKNIKPTKSLS